MPLNENYLKEDLEKILKMVSMYNSEIAFYLNLYNKIRILDIIQEEHYELIIFNLTKIDENHWDEIKTRLNRYLNVTVSGNIIYDYRIDPYGLDGIFDLTLQKK